MKLDLSNDLDRKKGIAYFKKLLDEKAKAEVKKIHEPRSIKQNSYFHVCLALSAIFIGYTLEEMKVVFKRGYGLIYTKRGQEFVKSSKDLDTKELWDFIEYIREQNSLEGNYIPTPEEYRQNKISIDNEIDRHKNFLK